MGCLALSFGTTVVVLGIGLGIYFANPSPSAICRNASRVMAPESSGAALMWSRFGYTSDASEFEHSCIFAVERYISDFDRNKDSAVTQALHRAKGGLLYYGTPAMRFARELTCLRDARTLADLDSCPRHCVLFPSFDQEYCQECSAPFSGGCNRSPKQALSQLQALTLSNKRAAASAQVSRKTKQDAAYAAALDAAAALGQFDRAVAARFDRTENWPPELAERIRAIEEGTESITEGFATVETSLPVLRLSQFVWENGWKLVLTSGSDAARATAIAERLAGIHRELAGEVEHGRFDSAVDALAESQRRVAEALSTVEVPVP